MNTKEIQEQLNELRTFFTNNYKAIETANIVEYKNKLYFFNEEFIIDDNGDMCVQLYVEREYDNSILSVPILEISKINFIIAQESLASIGK